MPLKCKCVKRQNLSFHEGLQELSTVRFRPGAGRPVVESSPAICKDNMLGRDDDITLLPVVRKINEII